MTEALAAQAPWWETGMGHGYHVQHAGLPDRRGGPARHRPVDRRLFREEPGGPRRHRLSLGARARARRALRRLHPAPAQPRAGSALARTLSAGPGDLIGLPLMRFNAYWNPPGLSGMRIVNTRAWRAAEVPSTNRHGNARAIARLSSALATDGTLDGVHVLAPETVARATAEQVYSSGPGAGAAHPLRPRLSAHHARAAAGARTRVPSGASAPAARWASPIPTRAWPSATP